MSTEWHQHRVMVHHGATDTRKGSKRPYETRTMAEVFKMPPDSQPKDRALAMLQSSYNAPDGRKHDVQQKLGAFVVLAMDIDEGDKSLDEVVVMVTAFVGEGVAWRVYSSSSAKEGNRKWRVIVLLASAVPYPPWYQAINAFFKFAEGRGFVVDHTLARAGQPVYLPNVPPNLRGADGEPLFFQSRVMDGRGLRITELGLPAQTLQVAQHSPLADNLRKLQNSAPPGPIERFNAAQRLEDLMVRYGYIQSPRSGVDWRSPLQTSESYATRIFTGNSGEQYWVSQSESDATAGLGREAKSGVRTGDAFDLFCHFEHGGDRKAAVAASGGVTVNVGDRVEELALATETGDIGAPFEPAALATLRAFMVQDRAGWMRIRARLKRAGVGITELDKQLRCGDGAQPDIDETVADKLIATARRECKFLHDPQSEPYAVFTAAGARQVHGVLSRGFSDFLCHAYYTQYDRAPTEASLRTALATLRGQAQFEGEACEVFTRIAKTDTGYWLDLCNDAWQCVQVTATGWAVVDGAGAPLFTRSSSMRPLPVPERGGTFDELWQLVNIAEADRLMVLAWMLESLRADTPHVVLELVGEQGSAKSSTQRALRRLIDPNQADLRAAPKSVEDVWVSARNSHMVSLENLSHLASNYQDALCVLATGGGFSSRTLYTNAEETIIELRKPIVLNGISVVVTAQDLLDRCLHIDLPFIKNRELAGDIEARLVASQPVLLGALLDLFVKVLAMLPSVSIAPEDRPRMADFASLGEAVFRVHGEPAGSFLSRYSEMRRDGVLRTIDASPVGAALIAYLKEMPTGFHGTLSDLLDGLNCYKPPGDAWPKTAKGLADALRRLAPALRQIGFECKPLHKTGGVIRWSIYPLQPQPVGTDPQPLRNPALPNPVSRFSGPQPAKPSPQPPQRPYS